MKMEDYQSYDELIEQLQEAAEYLSRCVESLSEVLPSQGARVNLQNRMILEAKSAKLKVLFDLELFLL